MKDLSKKAWAEPKLHVLDVDQTLSAGFFNYAEDTFSSSNFLGRVLNHLGTPEGS